MAGNLHRGFPCVARGEIGGDYIVDVVEMAVCGLARLKHGDREVSDGDIIGLHAADADNGNSSDTNRSGDCCYGIVLLHNLGLLI